MQAFKHIPDHQGEMEFALNDIPFYKAELTPDEEALILSGKLHEEYYILREWEFESHSENDGGIDAFDFGEEKIPLEPEHSILQNGEVIGFCYGVRVFLIQGGWGYGADDNFESIDGKGTVSSGSAYTLKKRK